MTQAMGKGLTIRPWMLAMGSIAAWVIVAIIGVAREPQCGPGDAWFSPLLFICFFGSAVAVPGAGFIAYRRRGYSAPSSGFAAFMYLVFWLVIMGLTLLVLLRGLGKCIS
jgi:hypothetical protein